MSWHLNAGELRNMAMEDSVLKQPHDWNLISNDAGKLSSAVCEATTVSRMPTPTALNTRAPLHNHTRGCKQ